MSTIIIGASTGPGRLLFDRLQTEGRPVIGLARQPRGITDSENAKFVALDATDTNMLASLLDEETTLVHCSRPELLTALLRQNTPLKRIVAVGSTRIYTRFPDDKCNRLAAMTHTISMGNVPATLLHPTMIYGAPGLNNVERIVKAAKVSPWIPLPDKGGSLIQPVYAADVVDALHHCLYDPETVGRNIILAGRKAVTYREFIECCVDISGEKSKVVSMPYFLLSFLAVLTHILPGFPTITQDEIRRLHEDKNFDTHEMIQLLGREPVALREGLAHVI